MTVEFLDEQDVSVEAKDLMALAGHVLDDRRVPADMDVTLLLVDLESMHELNLNHLGTDRPTDVLSFPIDEVGESEPDEPSVLGDIVLCPEYAEKQATERGRSLQDEMRLLVVHGILHLLGMDHDSPAAERDMFELTDRLLKEWGAPGHLETDGYAGENSDDPSQESDS